MTTEELESMEKELKDTFDLQQQIRNYVAETFFGKDKRLLEQVDRQLHTIHNMELNNCLLLTIHPLAEVDERTAAQQRYMELKAVETSRHLTVSSHSPNEWYGEEIDHNILRDIDDEKPYQEQEKQAVILRIGKANKQTQILGDQMLAVGNILDESISRIEANAVTIANLQRKSAFLTQSLMPNIPEEQRKAAFEQYRAIVKRERELEEYAKSSPFEDNPYTADVPSTDKGRSPFQ